MSLQKSLVSGVLSLCFACSAASAEDSSNHAVKIFTAPMAEKILGGPVEPSSRNSEPDTVNGKIWVSHARYTLKGGKDEVSVLIHHGSSKDEAETAFNQSKTMFKGVDVPGIGEAAYRTAMPPQLCVMKGMNWMIFSCGTFSKPNNPGQEMAAKELLPKITD